MSPTILTVDDHEGLRSALCSWIALNYPEARLLQAESGEEAVTLARAHAPDVVLMDLSLPRMSGIEAAAEIRALEPDAKLVIVTAYDAPVYRREAAAAGACAYVLKDRLGDELLSVLDALLTPSDRSQSEALPSGADGAR